MDLVCGVVPVKHEAKVSRASPIDVDLVVLLEYAGKIFNVFLVDVLYSKVVNNKGEADWAPIMTPISWCDLALLVPCLEEALGEEVLSNNAGLREAVHPALHFSEKVAICIVTESVFIDDVLGEQFQFHSEVLVPVHGSHEVEVLVYSRRYPKYSRLTLPWIPLRLRALFTLFSVLGVGPDPKAASPLARRRSICYPQHSAGGGGVTIAPFARLKKQ
jgi:hypothetical protein